MNVETVQAMRHASMVLKDIAEHEIDELTVIRLKSCSAIIDMAVEEEEANANVQ